MCDEGLWAQRQAASSSGSTTLYSAQGCLNRRTLGRVPDTELRFKPHCKQNKDHHVNHSGHGVGAGSAQGLGQVTLASTGHLGGWLHPGQPCPGELSEQLRAAHPGKSGWEEDRAWPTQGVISALKGTGSI